MRIDSEILSRHLHDAAVEQLVGELSAEGYSVERAPVLSGLRPDLVARRGDETIVLEVKALGSVGGNSLSEVAHVAGRLGAKFRLVVIRPDREIGIEVEGIEEKLLAALRRFGAERLKVPVRAVSKVADISIDSATLTADTTDLRGTATAIVRHAEKDEEPIPFGFKLRLDARREVVGAPEITPEFVGEEA